MKSLLTFTLQGMVGLLILTMTTNASVLPLSVFARYNSALKSSPLLTKSITSSCIMTVSDAICQELTMKNSDKKQLDLSRMLQVAITGMIWSGPVSHTWYGLLEKIVKVKNPILGLATRITLDAMIFSPVTVGGYFTCRSILEGSGWEGIQDKLATRYTKTVQSAWKFWPVANVVNFSMVPVEYRVLYSNVLSLFWTGWLTHINSKKIVQNNSAEAPKRK